MEPAKKHLEIIVPCYNEEFCIPIFYNEVLAVTDRLESYFLSFLFIDDGSKDRTSEVIEGLATKDTERVKFISFSRNFGKEAAMFAGLNESTGDYLAIMDCDLQHPPWMLQEMLQELENGYDCCAAKRTTRRGEPVIRSMFSNLFYSLSNKMSAIKMEPGVSDFRVMTRQMADAILSLHERERFSKGLFSWVGFQIKWLDYENVERVHGETKWSFISLCKYAISGIVAFTTVPLRFASLLGTMVLLGSFLYALYIVIGVFRFGATVPGYASIVVIGLFLGGIIIVLLGVIGEYLARIYNEVKQRPIYIKKASNTGKTEQIQYEGEETTSEYHNS